MAVRALVILHDEYGLPGLVGDRLRERGVDLEPLLVVDDFFDPVSDLEFPDPCDFDLIVPLGAPWSVYDTDTIGTWISRELEMLRLAIERDVPVFGICFGAQALAVALGGDVRPAALPEIGWYTIDSDQPESIATGPWLQWHHDVVTVPPGAKELARSEAGPQAFRAGRHLGVQFHPEMTPEVLEPWLLLGWDDLARVDVDMNDLRAETEVEVPAAAPHTAKLVDYVLDEVARLRP